MKATVVGTFVSRAMMASLKLSSDKPSGPASAGGKEGR